MRFWETTAFRVWLIFGTIGLIVSIPLSVYFNNQQREILQNYTKNAFDLNAAIASSVIEQAIKDESLDGLGNYMSNIANHSEFVYIAIIENEEVFACFPKSYISEALIKNEDYIYSESNLNTDLISGKLVITASKIKDELILKKINEPFIYLIIISILSSIILFALSLRFLSRPILKSTYIAKELGKQNYKVDINLLQGKNEISVLNNSLYSLKENLIHYKKENDNYNEDLKKQRDEIVDSLNYAKIIQESILPSESLFSNFFKSQFFLYKPKDIVSGDFYWAATKNKNLYFALCDCTGHGVPGSLLSMIGYDALNYINSLENINGSAHFMNKLNGYFTDSRAQGRMRFNDTMDMVMVMFNPNSKQLCISGSKQKVIILRNGKILEYNTDHLNLGDDFGVTNRSFTEEMVTLEKNDIIYLFTDGYVDQFGGESGKKMKYPRFRKLLLEIGDKPLSTQKEELEIYLNQWRTENNKVSYEQLDDISVIGFQVQ